jgi:3D (Asp-Asp-Asp) domain-containing protein
MLAIKKHAVRRIFTIAAATVAALLLIILLIGKKIYAINVDIENDPSRYPGIIALNIASTIYNTPAPVKMTEPVITPEDPYDFDYDPVMTRYEVEVETVTHAVRYLKDPSLLKGEMRIVTDGKDGTLVKTYRHTYTDGKITHIKLVEQTEDPAENQIILVGTKEDRNLPDESDMISELEIPEWFALDENGVPTEYSNVLTGKGVAYSAKPGAKTASGRTAKPGYVAVDPSVIPYGTELYIASTDNKHIYGYAIAADTGYALLDGRCIVDLFMGSYEESCDWGAHQVNIYILD